MKRYAFLIFFGALSTSAVFGQTKTPVEGVWRIVEEVAPVTNPAARGATTTYSNPQPGILIFTRGHYSHGDRDGRKAESCGCSSQRSSESDRRREDCPV